MTTAPANDGYWPSAWPGEDGGPQRRQTPAAPTTGLGLRDGASLVVATDRAVFGSNMVIQREVGELYLQGANITEGTAWVEQLDPVSLDVVHRSPDLPAGPYWPGGIAAHADGSLYVTQGRWCHRLAPDCTVSASRELPRHRPYNSLVVTGDGSLVMKDFVTDGSEGSELVTLAPGTLEVIDRLVLPEGSIARLSAQGDEIHVVGDHSLFLVRLDAGRLVLDEQATVRYRTIAGQTFGWDVVLSAGAGWFLDNGEGTEGFGGCFRGKTASSAPLHLVRVDRSGRRPRDVQLHEVCGEPGGIVANPPNVDDERGIVVGYDSGHGRMRAWRIGDDRLEVLWDRQQNHAGHMLRWPDSGELLTCDYDQARGLDQVVVLDIETGTELGRVDTTSPVQSVLFPCPGWAGDAYLVTFTTLSRVTGA